MFKRFFWASLIILIILAFVGCSGNSASSRSKKDRSGKSLVNENDGNSTDAASSKRKSEIISIDDDSLDMYVRIYGRDAVEEKGGATLINFDKIYGKIKKMKRKQQEEYYKSLYLRAQGCEKEGAPGKAASAYRECIYIENEIFKKPGLGQLALERLKNETYDRADELYKKNDYYNALTFAETAVYCDPGEFDSLKLAGELFSLTGEEGLSISYFSAALKIKPEDTELKYKLKTMLLLEGRPEKAAPLITPDISQYTRMKSHWVDLAEAYFMLSAMHPTNQDYRKKTEDALEKALDDGRISKIGKSELNFSRSLFRNDFVAAQEDLDKMSALNPESALVTRIMYDRALLYLAQGRRTTASELFEDTIRRADDHLNVTQGENYMALMSAWALDVMGKKSLTAREANRIFSRLKDPDHSYRQEFNYIREYLGFREKKKWNAAAKALVLLTKKRHLEPIGDFAQDILQIPVEKGLVYISLGRMYEKAGKKNEAWECFEKSRDNRFLSYLVLK